MFEQILLAVDGSSHALHAARVAGDLARVTQSKQVRIVVAFDPIPTYLGEPNRQSVIDARLLEAQRILEDAQRVLGSIPGEVHTELIEGEPAAAILDVAKTRKADLIVMGSRGLSPLVGLLVGSTSKTVLDHSPCPVMIIR